MAQRHAVLSEVMSGWTGTFTLNGVTITPRTRESVASLVARALREAFVTTDGSSSKAVSASVDTGGTLVLTSGTSITVDATLVTASRTGLVAGPYTATTVTADNPLSDIVQPLYGIGLDDLTVRTGRGRAVADGSYAAAPNVASATTTLRLFCSEAEAWTFEAAIGAWAQTSVVHDVWLDGAVLARVMFDGHVRRRAWSSRIEGGVGVLVVPMELACRVAEVSA